MADKLIPGGQAIAGLFGAVVPGHDKPEPGTT